MPEAQTDAAPATMRVQFITPMEGPRTADAPKGVSRRTGDQETVSLAEGVRLVSRGAANEVDADGKVLALSTIATTRNEEPEKRPAAPRNVERAVAVPVPAGKRGK